MQLKKRRRAAGLQIGGKPKFKRDLSHKRYAMEMRASAPGRPRATRDPARCGASALVAKELDILGTFVERHDLAALDDLAYLLDDIRIGERGDVAGVHVIGDGGQDAAHDFSGARLGHIRNDVDALGARDFANYGFDGGSNLLNDLLLRKNARLERDVDFGDAALHLVHHGNNGGFGDFLDGEASGFEFLGAEAVAGDVDDVVHAAENTVVAVGR